MSSKLFSLLLQKRKYVMDRLGRAMLLKRNATITCLLHCMKFFEGLLALVYAMDVKLDVHPSKKLE